MIFAVPGFSSGVIRPVLFQSAAIAVAALAGGMFGNMVTALAVVYGGVVALANSGLLIWRWHKGARDYHCDAGRHMRSFYRSMLERFFVVMLLLAAGFAWVGNQPLAVLAGFVVGQLAWMLATPTLNERT